MDTTTEPSPMELTRNPVDGTWGFICREHGIHRSGLAERHAHNVEAKHVREQHGDPLLLELNLAAGASVMATLPIDQWTGAVAVWQAMTGMKDLELERFLDLLADAPEPVRAAVVPF